MCGDGDGDFPARGLSPVHQFGWVAVQQSVLLKLVPIQADDLAVVELFDALLRAYGRSAPVADLQAMVILRLQDLATFSKSMAVTLGNSELLDHVALYRKDAAALK